MLAQIENAIAERLTLDVTEPKHVDIEEAHGALAMPAIEIFTNGGQFTRVAQRYKLRPLIYVVVTFRNMRSVRDRRAGMYPVLEAVASSLTLQTLGLDIDPLVPRRMENVTLREETDEGKVVFLLEFQTGFTVERLADGTPPDYLLTAAFEYFLKPGDDIADAEDIITFGSEDEETEPENEE